MNKNNRMLLKSISNIIVSIATNLVISFLSICRVLVLSSIKVAIKERNYFKLRKYDVCCVLATGPSLKSAITNGELPSAEVDYFVVNLFCQSDYFQIIKPRFYFIVDGAFFSPTDERGQNLVNQLANKLNKVDWEMYLVVSSGAPNDGILKNITNSNVKILKMNSTTIEGYNTFRNMMYKLQLGMPRCQTVTNFALSAGITMKYNKILLYGADHSWTRDLFVDDDNVVCYGDRHVYNTNLTVIKHKRTMAEILSDFSKMFATHEIIRQYADTENVKIINMTKGSFVDAYDRN